MLSCSGDFTARRCATLRAVFTTLAFLPEYEHMIAQVGSGAFRFSWGFFVPFRQVEAIRSDESSETGGSEDGQNGRGAAAPASSVQLVTTRPVAKGESLEMRPVCIVRDDNVSKIGNQELLCNYGFVDVESGRERASIDFNVRA